MDNVRLSKLGRESIATFFWLGCKSLMVLSITAAALTSLTACAVLLTPSFLNSSSASSTFSQVTKRGEIVPASTSMAFAVLSLISCDSR